MRSADDIFRSEIDKLGLSYSITSEGLYEIPIAGQTVKVSLENIRRNYDRDGDATAISRFAQKVSTTFLTKTPSWEDVRPFVRYSLEPNDYETGLEDVFFNVVSAELLQVFVYTPADGSSITWIDDSMLVDWGVTRELVALEAEKNMAEIVAGASLEVDDIDGNHLGMIATEETSFKASLILSPQFRSLVSPALGWPVRVVVPCRDFVYVVRCDKPEFLPRLGGVVVREFHSSGHSITKDVLEVSNDGIKAIGTFGDLTP